MKLSAMLIDVLGKLPYEDNVRWLADVGYSAVDPPLLEPRAGDIARRHGQTDFLAGSAPPGASARAA